jgi:hypothetical protein
VVQSDFEKLSGLGDLDGHDLLGVNNLKVKLTNKAAGSQILSAEFVRNCRFDVI